MTWLVEWMPRGSDLSGQAAFDTEREAEAYASRLIPDRALRAVVFEIEDEQ